jgi:adenylate kinase family enzyme
MIVDLLGAAENINVRLEKSQLRFENTITLTNQKTVKILNRSEHMVMKTNQVKFKWKNYANEQEDAHEREKRIFQLQLEEEEEVRRISGLRSFHDISLIRQKFGNLRKNIQEEELLFENAEFRISPSSGVVWPHSTTEIQLFFSPNSVGEFSRVGYCEIEGRETRLPLQLRGVAKGPRAKFSYSSFQVKDIFINTIQSYEVVLENLGDIPTNFAVRSSETLFGPQFQFTPDAGKIEVGEQVLIQVMFKPSHLGDFKEFFLWDLEGGTDPLVISYEGCVIGPTFHFDCENLIIPNASYGFSIEKVIRLLNTSPIPMNFELNQVDEFEEKEEDIVLLPKDGKIDGCSSIDITVVFSPRRIGSYKGHLSVDVLSVGKDLRRLPYETHSIVPEISVLEPSFRLGECFLDFPYTKDIVFVNNTDYASTYSIEKRDHTKNLVYTYQCENYTGVVPAQSSIAVNVEIRVKRLGPANFPIIIRMIGAETKPLVVDVAATGVGPILSLQREHINWGKVPVLEHCVQDFEVTNNSPIAASFLCTIAGESQNFRVEPTEGSIPPGEKFTITVTAFLDDTAKFTDVLNLAVVSSDTFEIPLVARGVGSTIVYDADLAKIDFGDVFSNRECASSYTLYNKGRRTQHLQWSHIPTKDPAILSQQIFEVIPSRFTLRPGGHQVIHIKGYSNIATTVLDKLVCHATTDKDPSRQLLLECILQVNFVHPVLDIEPSRLVFHSSHTTDDSFLLLSEDLHITNVAGLPLTVSLKCPEPFKLDPDTSLVHLSSGEAVKIPITFDPTFNLSRISTREEAKLCISYKEHPQKDMIELISEVFFPNLNFSESTVDFGCIQNHVESLKVFEMTNTSKLPVAYEWYFLTDPEQFSNQSHQAFDIHPMKGYIEPGEREKVKVYMYGAHPGTFQTRAMCDVSGGPKYEIVLKGQSSEYAYAIDNTELNFGVLSYQSIVEQEIVLSNRGQVDFDFIVRIPDESCLNNSILVIPASGVVKSGERQSLSVRFCPSVPESFHEAFYIKIAHFEPEKIAIKANAWFPRIVIQLPTEEDAVRQSLIPKPNEISTIAVGQEIERAVLKRKTEEFLLNDERGYVALEPKQSFAGSTRLFNKLNAKKKEKGSQYMSETSNVVQCTYICDFGTVIRNSTSKKTFTLQNLGPQPISFTLLKGQASNLLSVEPEKVKNLPVGEVIELTATYVARAEENDQITEIPLVLLNGPTHLIRFKVGISVPDLILGENNSIDFGELMVGFRKSIVLQVTNPNPVPCEWVTPFHESFQKQSKSLANSLKNFEIVPPNGYLEPFEKSSVTIRFSPTEQRDFEFDMPIRLHMNPKIRHLHVVGRSVKPLVVFEPSSLCFGPILPYSEGIETKVVIQNVTPHPIELYSVDFDGQYRFDEENLKQLEGYDHGILYVPYRDGNWTLMDYVTMHRKKQSPEKKEDAEMGVGELQRNTSNTVACLTENIASDGPSCIILLGPPICGKTSQSKRISRNFRKKYVTVDSIIEQSTLLNESGNGQLKLENFEDRAQFTEDQISTLIRQWVAKEDWQNSPGYVFDGIDSKYCNSLTFIMKILCRALCEKTKKVHVVHLTLDRALIRDRECVMQETQFQAELNSLRVKELPEDEYDALPTEEKIHYDSSMSRYKARLKEILEKRPRERRSLQPDDRLPDRKSDEKIRTKRAHSRAATNDKPEKTSPNYTSAQRTEKTKKGGSPKFGKRLVGEKHPEKEGKHVEKVPEKESTEDGLLEENFLNESTMLKLENYLSNIEGVLSAVREKEQDKSSHVAKGAGFATMNAEKKQKGMKVTQNELLVSNLEAEVHVEEVPLPELHEINTNGLEEDAVYKLIQELIPLREISQDFNGNSRSVAEPFLEKLIYLPKDREKHMASKPFSIGSVAMISESDPEHSGEAGVNLTQSQGGTAIPVVKAGTDGKADGKKVTKQLLKPTEEKGSELEEEIEKESSGTYRWVLSPGEKKDIMVRYNPSEATRIETNLIFEVMGFSGQFNLPCVGVCEYSSLNMDYKKMFSKCRKAREQMPASGEFILSTGTYEFGPLLFNKPREKYLDKSPENKGNFLLINSSNYEARINLAFRADGKGDTFTIDAQSFTIPAGKSHSVNFWAFPKSVGLIEDTMVISVKDNPEPYCFRVSCLGVKPELEIDKKTFAFDRLLLGRGEKREMKLKNSTSLPISWKLSGLEALGDEISLYPIEGYLETFGEMSVVGEFRALKSMLIKKMVKIEVTDSEKIGGISQEIPILVTAEAYDISMDIHFPKGFEGGLDFGTIKVGEDGKQLVTLKNKGKYEVGFRFIFDSAVFVDLINITPPQGIIQPSEKPFFVQIIFKSNTEIALKDYPVLKCIVFEPSTGEVTASIPVKVSARSVFSKYTILPMRDLNFGALIHGTKAAKQIIIENTGEFDFKYSIFKMALNRKEKQNKSARIQATLNGVLGSIQQKNRPPSPPPTTKVSNKKDIIKQADSLSFGPFTVFPITAILAPGMKQIVTVEFLGEVAGLFEETIGIDITDRSPLDNPDGIEYQLMGESCIPGINTFDFASIFEEYSVCKRLELFRTQTAVYGEEDRVFHYGAYLAGQQAQVQFKISNPFKVTCDVVFSTRPRGKSKSDSSDFAFDVEPKRLTIPSHEHRYVTVSFHPSSIQTYSGVFEAMVENVSEGKNKCLTFELRGEGTLPRVCIEKPSLRGKNGIPLLKFKRLLLGKSQTLPIILKNDGIVSAKFKLEWYYKDNDDFFCKNLNAYHQLRPGDTRTIEISCQPSSVRKLEGELKLKVLDNTFEDTSIQILGEGYLDDLTIEDIGDEIENEICFSDCYVGETRFQTFRLVNHSSEWIKVGFPENPDFTFAPMSLHIPAKAERSITASFTPKAPCDIQHHVISLKVCKIRYVSPPPDIAWDDRMKMLRWSNDGVKGTPKKVVESVPEPNFETLMPLNDYHLTLNGMADFSSFECEQASIKFKSTLMYQTRVYRFPLKNTGKVSLRFAFEIFEDETCVMVSKNSPFDVSPSTGKVLPGDMVMIVVRFSPVDVDDYKASIQAKIANLAKDQKQLQFVVEGSSLRPYCHFELDDVNPLSLETRTSERSIQNGVPFILEPSTKIIEFRSCGIKVKTTKKFYIVNPTYSGYEFQWKLESVDHKTFRCLTPKGLVAPNKKSEIVFEFYSETLETKESLWTFSLTEHNVKIPFLLIGSAVEPTVLMSQPGIHFRSVLVGRQAKEVVNLVNEEGQPFSFQFNDTSVEMDAQGVPVVRINPMNGTIPANSELPIEITFLPLSEKLYNFNLMCNVRKKPTPVSLNVKGEGYIIRDSLSLEMADGSICALASDSDNLVDFGLVQINEKCMKRVCITNSGKFNFDFSWKMSKKCSYFGVFPELGTVQRGEKAYCDLYFKPSSASNYKDVKLFCQIQNGRSYSICVQGTGSKPLIRISPPNLDFGPHFTIKGTSGPILRELEIHNSDSAEMVIDISAVDRPWFDFPKGIQTIPPNDSILLPVSFYPREAMVYEEVIKLEVNGLSQLEIPISGEGCELKLDTEISSVNFGALRIGNTSTKSLKITNKSKIGFPFNLGPSLTLQSLAASGVTFNIMSEFDFKPRTSVKVEVKFAPQKRTAAFNEEIITEHAGHTKPLFLISGACQGTEVRLETDSLPFGAVVQRSYTTRKVHLQNVGDIGAKFNWETAKLPKDFTISPLEGYISPGMEIPIEVAFHPRELNVDIRAENTPCRIEGMGKLYLTLSGLCIPQPNHLDILKYFTPARTIETKSIQITNRSSNHWHLCPIIDNDYWSGPQFIDIEPGQTRNYDLNFYPLETNGTGEGGKHEGTIFFPIPDGTGILYRLSGVVDRVLPVATISREIPCKTVFSEIVTVTNWLRKFQRLKIIPDFGKVDNNVVFKGHEFVDLGPLQSKEYKFTYFAYKESVSSLKLTFKNENSQEYLYYNFNYKNLPPGIMSTLEMSSPVRQLQVKEIPISNPLATPASFTGTSTNPDVTVPHSFMIPAR